MTLNVNIPSTDNVKNIHYYIDDVLVYSGKETTYQVTRLETGKEYSVYAIVEYENEKIITTEVSKDVPDADIYVSTEGNDETGEGTIDKPYASLEKAIDVFVDNQKIYIFPGTYILNKMDVSNYAQVGIYDEGKSIEIFGENENTILVFDASSTTCRDGNALCLSNSNTVVRSLIYVFKPKNASSYSRAIFNACNGSVYNIFFKISGSYKASYLYYNSQSVPTNIINCTFFHDLGAVDDNHSGKANFNNIATNVLTKGTNTNVIVKNFGTAETTLTELVNNSRENEDFITNQVGVYYGQYAW